MLAGAHTLILNKYKLGPRLAVGGMGEVHLAQNPDGKTVVYRVEGGPPNSLFRQGWRKDSLKVGEEVTVKGIRAKRDDSMNIGQASITTADGRRMFAGTGQAAQAQQ